MNIIVTQKGFGPDQWEANGGFFIDLEKYGQDVSDKAAANTCLDIPNDTDLDALTGILGNVAMIRIPFPSFADGRGFSLASQLRQQGFAGKLRAFGHVISDQFGFAIDCGFDEVEISPDLAERQPEEQWLARLPDAGLSYQNKWLGRQESQQV